MTMLPTADTMPDQQRYEAYIPGTEKISIFYNRTDDKGRRWALDIINTRTYAADRVTLKEDDQ
ncbi:hypothetical protein VVR12_01630 [Rothia sp. LK2588]|uniref:hypothetical protein n=1 Tax=Rothia sp. LK2588 TaxID=3114369 RepID=UPI0034CF3CC1